MGDSEEGESVGERRGAVRVTKSEGDSTCSASHEMVLVSLGRAKKYVSMPVCPLFPSQSSLERQTSVARTKGHGFIRPQQLNRLLTLYVVLLYGFFIDLFFGN